MKLTTSAQMRELDRIAIEERGIPSIDLMERAAAAVAAASLELLPDRPGRCTAAVLCGAGNNGGDGIGAARHLFLKGVRVRALLVGAYEKLTPDALEETRRLSECGVELEPFDPENAGQRASVLGADVRVDALFGVGLSRPIAPDTRLRRRCRLDEPEPGCCGGCRHRQRCGDGHGPYSGHCCPGRPDRHLHPAESWPGGGRRRPVFRKSGRHRYRHPGGPDPKPCVPDPDGGAGLCAARLCPAAGPTVTRGPLARCWWWAALWASPARRI